MHDYPAFSKFRYWLDLWDEASVQFEDENKLRMMIDGNKLILFFNKDDDVYGAPESSRLMFAKMKKPDDDCNQDWLSQAHFMGLNLSKMIDGGQEPTMFGHKDIDNIGIIDADAAIGKLLEKLKGKKNK